MLKQTIWLQFTLNFPNGPRIARIWTWDHPISNRMLYHWANSPMYTHQFSVCMQGMHKNQNLKCKKYCFGDKRYFLTDTNKYSSWQNFNYWDSKTCLRQLGRDIKKAKNENSLKNGGLNFTLDLPVTVLKRIYRNRPRLLFLKCC